MNCANIIIIGKTGAGKSTLVNAIVNDNVAPTGKGAAVTKENKVYCCNKHIQNTISKSNEWDINVYDTVGLELDEKITENTIKEVEQYLANTKRTSDDTDIIIVWLCINQKSNRFEKYELDIVDKMSIEYEIPFSVIITQCLSDEDSIIEQQLRQEYSEIVVKRLLAEDYRTRAGVFKAYGVEEAIISSINEYNQAKVEVLENKLKHLRNEREKRVEEIKENGKACIKKHGKSAGRIGIIPGGCIPFVHGICIKMLMDLDRIAGIDSSKGFADSIFANVIVGLIATPFMAVPVLSPLMAIGYVEGVGETYLEALLAVIEWSTDKKLKNNDIVASRIKDELMKRKK